MTLPAATDLARSFASRRRIAAAAAFLLVAAAAGRADASCGDWLVGHNATPGHSAAQSGDAPKAPAPCDGPACRRSREHSPAVPPAPTRQLDNTERWCRLAEELASRPSLFASAKPVADAFPLTGFRLSIERPPRA